MATFFRREFSRRYVEYVVPTDGPWGACYVEINKAMHNAAREYRRSHGIPDEQAPADDAIRYHCGDDEIVIRFEVEEPSGGFVATATECRQCQQTEAMSDG